MEELLGGFLVGEAALSIVVSQDQRIIANIGRGLRIAVGLWLIRQGKTYQQISSSRRRRLN
jgi:hypothetical protein